MLNFNIEIAVLVVVFYEIFIETSSYQRLNPLQTINANDRDIKTIYLYTKFYPIPFNGFRVKSNKHPSILCIHP